MAKTITSCWPTPPGKLPVGTEIHYTLGDELEFIKLLKW